MEMKCYCGAEYKAREADLKRGWALACSKSCAAKRKTHGFPAATKINGDKIPNKWKSAKKKRPAKKKTRPDNFDEDYHNDFAGEGHGQWLD